MWTSLWWRDELLKRIVCVLLLLWTASLYIYKKTRKDLPDVL